MPGFLTDIDKECHETEPTSDANDLSKHFCPNHTVSGQVQDPRPECCATWERFQQVWSDYNPFDPDDKTTQEDLTFMVHCMWRWPFEMWE